MMRREFAIIAQAFVVFVRSSLCHRLLVRATGRVQWMTSAFIPKPRVDRTLPCAFVPDTHSFTGALLSMRNRENAMSLRACAVILGALLMPRMGFAQSEPPSEQSTV